MENLNKFCGTENYYKHFTGGFYTDGVKYVAETAGAYWLLDAIFSYARREPFQIWTLKLVGKEGALLTMIEDAGMPEKVRQDIPYTDFPENIGFYLVDNVLMLKSEY